MSLPHHRRTCIRKKLSTETTHGDNTVDFKGAELQECIRKIFGVHGIRDIIHLLWT